MKFHEKLQTLRKEKGLSQEGLADILGVSRQAISKWESGQSYPEMEKLIALSELFGTTMDNLVKDGTPLSVDEGTADSPMWIGYRRQYEYKSKRTLFGLPLVHVNIGNGRRHAKGIVAVGNIATGVIAVGGIAAGILSVGVLSAGLFSLGALSAGLAFSAGAISVGGFSIGGVSIGIISLGGLSVGAFTIGGASFASHIAIGNHATGHIAIGEVAKGAKAILDTSPRHDFSLIKASEVRELINNEFPHLWKWVVDFMVSIFR